MTEISGAEFKEKIQKELSNNMATKPLSTYEQILAEGKIEGKIEGIVESKINVLVNLLLDTDLSNHTIAAVVGVHEESVAAVLDVMVEHPNDFMEILTPAWLENKERERLKNSIAVP